MVLNWGWFCLPGNIWQCLETFLFFTTGVGLEAATGICILPCTGQLPKTNNYLVQNVHSA